MWIPDHIIIFFTMMEYRILGDLLAFLTQSPHRLAVMAHANKRMNPKHTGTDLTAVQKSGFEFRITFWAWKSLCSLSALVLHSSSPSS